MAQEIERKFLVRADQLPALSAGVSIEQGYLVIDPMTVRVRRAGNEAFLTLKGSGRISRAEYEYAIPPQDAAELLTMCTTNPIEKTRYKIPTNDGLHWEIDVFEGTNKGLIVAELEMPSEDHHFERPAWLGDDVTTIERYRNSALARRPYTSWTAEEKAQPTSD